MKSRTRGSKKLRRKSRKSNRVKNRSKGGNNYLTYGDIRNIFKHNNNHTEFVITFKAHDDPIMNEYKIYGLQLQYANKNQVVLSVGEGALLFKPQDTDSDTYIFMLLDNDNGLEQLVNNGSITEEISNKIASNIENETPYYVTIEKYDAKQNTVDAIYALEQTGTHLPADNIQDLYHYIK